MAALAMVCPATALAQTVTIAALGDSLTQGFGLPQEDGLVPQLEAWLTARGHDVDVLNAGVSGDTTAGGRARVGWTITPEVDAMIVALGGNDLLRGLPPEETRANLDAILATATDAGLPVLLVGLSAPGNYGADYQAQFDAIFPDLAASYDAILYDSFFAAFDDIEDRPQAAATYMQSDGIHPNADGVAAIVAAFGPAVEDLLERVD